MVGLRDFEEVLRPLAPVKQVERKIEELVPVVMKNEVTVGEGRMMSEVGTGRTPPYLGFRSFPHSIWEGRPPSQTKVPAWFRVASQMKTSSILLFCPFYPPLFWWVISLANVALVCVVKLIF